MGFLLIQAWYIKVLQENVQHLSRCQSTNHLQATKCRNWYKCFFFNKNQCWPGNAHRKWVIALKTWSHNIIHDVHQITSINEVDQFCSWQLCLLLSNMFIFVFHEMLVQNHQDWAPVCTSKRSRLLTNDFNYGTTQHTTTLRAFLSIQAWILKCVTS